MPKSPQELLLEKLNDPNISDKRKKQYLLLLDSTNIKGVYEKTVVKPHKPSGKFDVYIANDDEIHKDGFVDGIDVVGGMPDIEAFVGTGDAQRYEGYLNLDINSPDIGKVSGAYGLRNTRISTGISQYFSAGTYQDENQSKEDTKGSNNYNKLINHPNYTLALHQQLKGLDAYAKSQGADMDKLIETMKSNNPELGKRFEEIVNKNINYRDDYSFEGSNNYGNYGSIERIEKLDPVKQAEFFEESVDEEGKTKKIKITRDIPPSKNYSEISDTFDSAPEQFKNSFKSSLINGIISLKYPHDAVYGTNHIVGGVSGQDHIVIEMFQYQGSQSHIFTKEGKQSKLNLTGLRRVSNIKQYIGAVRLPIPNNLSFSNGVSWGDGRLNAVEAAAFMTSNALIADALDNPKVGDVISAGKSNLGQLINDIKSGELSSQKPAGLLLSAFASQFALGRVGINVDANQFIQRGVGQSINPNLELLFNGPKLRSFTFSFNFAPNDELDASIMRKMQRFFKQGMAPKRNNENLIFLGSPNVFRIRYRTKHRDRIKGLPIHKICALTTCEINYAPDNVYQSYEDTKAGSSPIRTIMNLNFTELTPIFENDYRSEYEQTNVPDSGAPQTEFNDDFQTPFIMDVDGNAGVEFDSISEEDTGF